jgi:hypothetical protein
MRFPGSMRDHRPLGLPAQGVPGTRPHAAAGCGAYRTEVIPASDEKEVVSRAEDDKGREIAEELEQQHPRWIVIFGAFTREFVCLPRFAVPHGLKVVAVYPKAAACRMSEIERLCRVREGLRKTSERTDET